VSQLEKSLFYLLIFCCGIYIGYKIDKTHTIGHDRCVAANGVWVDREMKCIKAEEIKL
jgi:hypothetical protein